MGRRLESLWWCDESTPLWWAYIAAGLRRAWYRSTIVRCTCPGCIHYIPRWWSAGLCECCATEECFHDCHEDG
jgi:hypothetical protein